MEDYKDLVMRLKEELKAHKDQTKETFAKHEIRMDKHDERMDKMNDIQIVHGQQIASIMETLKDIKSDTLWLRRLVTGGVISGTISAIITFIVFAIQKLT